jgi:hypothetical protein
MRLRLRMANRHKKTLEKGEYLQGSNAYRQERKAPLREEKREVLDAPVGMRCIFLKSFKFFSAPDFLS